MKTKAILFLGAMLALTACSNEDGITTAEPAGTDGPAQAITFNLTASHPDDGGAAQTRAVKQGWENGDAIFVFFSNVAAPKHLKMTFNGSAWTSAEYDGPTQTPGALGLKNGDTGTMRAVYLPFGSGATVSANGDSFKFSTMYYSYYATATLAYTVTDNTVSGAFNMEIPEKYVQFFVEDAEAKDGDYTLATDAVIPIGIMGVDKDGDITSRLMSAGDPMPGYAYGGGYLFSGKLNGSYTSKRYVGGTPIDNDAYYFAKKRVDGSRADYFVTGKSLASHKAVKLPANSSVYAVNYDSPNTGKWVPVGSGITVSLFRISGETASSLGTWYTCNDGRSVPEALGPLYTFDKANELGVTLPTKAEFEFIANNTNCTHTWLTVHGQPGFVIKANRGFMFLPAHSGTIGCYWSSTENGDDNAWFFYINNGGLHAVHSDPRNLEYAVRPIKKP